MAHTRLATAEDADVVAGMLVDFNTEFGGPVPDVGWLTGRIRELIATGDTEVVVIETDRVDGLAVLRYRPSLWEAAEECSLAELYVRPDRRGGGLGRALLLAATDHATARGATSMDLATTNQDTAAVALYESVGFDRHERRGPEVLAYFFEIDLPAPDSPGGAAGR